MTKNPPNELVSATKEQIEAAFTEWLRRYQADPELFEAEQALLTIAPTTYGESCTPYFLKMLSEIANTPACDAGPAPAVFCKDCSHIRDAQERFPYCAAPGTQRIDLVRGPLNLQCEELRATKGPCGIEGRLFALHTTSDIGDISNSSSQVA